MHADLRQLAATQDGLLTRADILAAGMRPDTLAKWVRRGRLRALHRGVYAPSNLVITPRVTARAATTGRSDAAAGYETAAGIHDIGVLALTGPPHALEADGREPTRDAAAGIYGSLADERAGRVAGGPVHLVRRPAPAGVRRGNRAGEAARWRGGGGGGRDGEPVRTVCRPGRREPI